VIPTQYQTPYRCEVHKILAIFPPPHCLNQLQPFDLCTVRVAKKRNRFDEIGKNAIQMNHILQVVEAFGQAAVPSSNVGSFQNAGISVILDVATGPHGDEILYPLCPATSESCRCLTTALFDTTQLIPETTHDDSDFQSEETEEEEDMTVGQLMASMRGTLLTEEINKNRIDCLLRPFA
jgi:hypothetical protein